MQTPSASPENRSRSEIGTQRKRGRWLRFILGPGKSADDFVHEHGRKVSEVMTKDPFTIT